MGIQRVGTEGGKTQEDPPLLLLLPLPFTLMNTQPQQSAVAQQPQQASVLLPQQSAQQSLVVNGQTYCEMHPPPCPFLHNHPV